MNTPEFSMIVAHDLNRAIGITNTLPWTLPTDMARFRKVTAGKVVLMGRKTAESIGRALPNRLNLILTRSGTVPYAGQVAVTSLEEARQLAGEKELICIGGGEIYELMLPHVDRVYVTEIHTRLPLADAWFPDIIEQPFDVVDMYDPPEDPRDQFPIRFFEYARRKG